MTTNNIKITNTSLEDWDIIMGLFRKAIELQGKNSYKVWAEIDEVELKKDIENRRQYKILKDNNVLCVFSVQFNDPFIWGKKDQNNAIYLHRIVVNPNFKGQKQFKTVLNWAKQYALQNHLQYVRMDTWADNAKIISYYQTFGFKFIGNHQTGNEPELPLQNRNLKVALLEMDIGKTN